MFFAPGTPRLAVLDSTGAKVKTLVLPMPNEGEPKVRFLEEQDETKLYNRARRTRIFGYIPEVTLTWSAYDDRTGEGVTIGTADGNRPSAADLLVLLSSGPGLLKFSPGPSAGGFVVQTVEVGESGVTSQGYAKDLKVTLRGGDLLTTRALGSW